MNFARRLQIRKEIKIVRFSGEMALENFETLSIFVFQIKNYNFSLIQAEL
jgi:hypothetical protein